MVKGEKNLIKKLLKLQSETYVHPGSGQSSSFVDLPVTRESITDYPFITSSSLKGSFKNHLENLDASNELIKNLFGEPDKIANFNLSDARLLLLPVRSLTSHYKWITCNYILERLIRDLTRLGRAKELNLVETSKVEDQQCLAKTNEKFLFLEEREFVVIPTIDQILIDTLSLFIPEPSLKTRLPNQLVILSDNAFKWFANYGLAINARNVLTENKTSDNLWYEETIPPDSIFYSLIFSKDESTMKQFNDIVFNNPYVQTGGNESIGQGWFKIEIQ